MYVVWSLRLDDGWREQSETETFQLLFIQLLILLLVEAIDERERRRVSPTFTRYIINMAKFHNVYAVM
jgi:hypothetical protein